MKNKYKEMPSTAALIVVAAATISGCCYIDTAEKNVVLNRHCPRKIEAEISSIKSNDILQYNIIYHREEERENNVL